MTARIKCQASRMWESLEGSSVRHLVFIRECYVFRCMIILNPFHHERGSAFPTLRKPCKVSIFSCLVSSVLIHCSNMLQMLFGQTCDGRDTLRCSAARRRRGCGSANTSSVKCQLLEIARHRLQIRQTRWQTRWSTRQHRWWWWPR